MAEIIWQNYLWQVFSDSVNSKNDFDTKYLIYVVCINWTGFFKTRHEGFIR